MSSSAAAAAAAALTFDRGQRAEGRVGERAQIKLRTCRVAAPKVAAALLPAWEKVFYVAVAMAVGTSLLYCPLCSATVVDGTGRVKEEKKKKVK